jgi:signal transduction histidine kinase
VAADRTGTVAVNARDAMPRGGKLAIEIANAELTEEDSLRRYVIPGKYVLSKVTDTGIGIDRPHKSASFESFFSAMEKGK